MTASPSERRARKDELRLALASKEPYRIAAAIELPAIKPPTDDVVSTPNNSSRQSSSSLGGESLQESGVEWGGVLTALLDASDAATEGDVVRCCEAQATLHAALNHIFGSIPGNWLVPALHTACRNTQRTAVLADVANLSRGGRNDHARLKNAVTLLQESFSKTLNDRKDFKPNSPLSEEGSKKAGVLYIVNQLFSMYFRLNTLRLCKNLLRPVESGNLHEQGTMGEMVTYRYYIGRLNMFEDQYEAAEQNLDFCLLHCHKDAVGNKKRILNYLLPVKLLRGRLPTKLLLEKYDLHEFVSLVHGIRNGDLRTFNDGLAKYQDLFIRRGTYLLLEKCKTVCYRNLFKRVYTILERSQISLDQVAKCFQWLGMSIDLDEMECIVANLIYRGYVRGYISHSKRILVLSKKDPFPISSIISN